VLRTFLRWSSLPFIGKPLSVAVLVTWLNRSADVTVTSPKEYTSSTCLQWNCYMCHNRSDDVTCHDHGLLHAHGALTALLTQQLLFRHISASQSQFRSPLGYAPRYLGINPERSLMNQMKDRSRHLSETVGRSPTHIILSMSKHSSGESLDKEVSLKSESGPRHIRTPT